MRAAAAILFRLVLFAVLGAATTVAVAWGLALKGVDTDAAFADQIGETVAVPFDDEGVPSVVLCRPMSKGTGWRHMFLNIDAAGAVDLGRVSVMHQMGDTLYPISYSLPDERHMPPLPANGRTEFWFGWPMPCLWTAEDRRSSGCFMRDLGWERRAELYTPKGEISHPFYRSDRKAGGYVPGYAIPTGVLPPAALSNTAFYAGAWWIVLFGVKRARGQIRAWRGRCRGCAYSLAGLEPGTPCPECGKRRVP